MSMTEVSADHPYSPAFVAAGLVFVSGALSVDATGVPVPGRMAALDAAVERLATVGGEPTVRASLRRSASRPHLRRGERAPLRRDG